MSATYTWQPDTPRRRPRRPGSRAFSRETLGSHAASSRCPDTLPHPTGCCLSLPRTPPSLTHAPLPCNTDRQQGDFMATSCIQPDVASPCPQTLPPERHTPLPCNIVTQQGDFIATSCIQPDVLSLPQHQNFIVSLNLFEVLCARTINKKNHVVFSAEN